jgi:transcriptional regulator with XRE-family HTH domain
MEKNNDKFNYEVADTALNLIGKHIADCRKYRGYSQAELAQKASTSQQHIAKFEAGKQNISIKLFIAILGSMDMHINLTFKDADNMAGFPPPGKN